MENSNIEGHWIGTFIEKVNETEVVFTEYVEVKKLFLELFAKAFLKKQLVQFVADFKKIWRYITYEENDRILWFGL